MSKQPPIFLGKFFNTTRKGQQLMHTDGRICELDRSSHKRELVYDFTTKKLCAVNWSQHSLYDAAMQGM
jgi:hypothetical protein